MAGWGVWQEDQWRQEDWEEWQAQWWQRDGWQQSWWRDHWHEQRLHQPEDVPAGEDDGWQGMTVAMLERNARVTATSPLSHQWADAKAASKNPLEASAESAPSEPDPWKVIADLLAGTAPEEKLSPEVTPESAACKSESVPEEKQ